jgi:hypothetical protein
MDFLEIYGNLFAVAEVVDLVSEAHIAEDRPIKKSIILFPYILTYIISQASPSRDIRDALLDTQLTILDKNSSVGTDYYYPVI